ncbi:hypothetical protein Tco_0741777 [Tanacetum coccineum]
MMMRLFRSDDKFSQMLDQFESSPEFGGASGSGGCGDDEPGGDEDDDEDEEDGDSLSYKFQLVRLFRWRKVTYGSGGNASYLVVEMEPGGGKVGVKVMRILIKIVRKWLERGGH